MSGKTSKCILITSLFLFATATFSTTTYCVAQTEVYVDPPEVEDSTLRIGDRFSISVLIANVSDLRSYEFNMSYDTSVLTCVGLTAGPEDNIPLSNWELDSRGNIWINVMYDVPITTMSPVTVATLTFSVQSRGTSILDLYHTHLLDSLGKPIPHEVFDGSFSSGTLYDINQDGYVNIDDIAIVAASFGSAAQDDPETPWNEARNWNPDADVNEDEVVDIFDLVLIGVHFGET